MNLKEYLSNREKDRLYFGMSEEEEKNIIAQLPDKTYYEYAFHKYLNDPSITFDKWAPWPEWQYPIADLLRIKKILLDNKDIIVSKKIVDIGCHLGYFSFICDHLGAHSVTGTNVRQQELGIAREIQQAGKFDNIDFVWSDVHDYAGLEQVCANADTAILSGVIYHVNDHFQILKAITDSGVTNFIIDNVETATDLNIGKPAITFKLEDTNIAVNGWNQESNGNENFYGCPNQAWIESALGVLGWELIRKSRYQKKDGKFRCVSAWKKK